MPEYSTILQLAIDVTIFQRACQTTFIRFRRTNFFLRQKHLVIFNGMAENCNLLSPQKKCVKSEAERYFNER